MSLIEPRLASAKPDVDLDWAPAWRVRELVAARKLSPVEATEHFLNRIEALDPPLHAFRDFDAERAREAARQAEAAMMAGEPLGLLHGAPIAVKELIAVRGEPFYNPAVGHRVVSERDSIEVERLRAAGAVIVGVTVGGLTTREFGASDQQPQNPWDRTRVCGDSSTGAACAVAAGMVPAALGTDGQGSNRLPGAYCGLIGLLPTRGRVATADWRQLVNRFISGAGPITRDVRDAGLMLQALAGPDARDLVGLPDDPPDYLAGLDEPARGMRVGWTDDFGYTGAYAGPESARVIETVRRAAQGLGAIGVQLEDLREPFDDPSWLADKLTVGDPGLGVYQPLSLEDVAKVRVGRLRLSQSFRRALEGNDFILAPASQHVAPMREAWADSWSAPGYMANYAAHTAAANVLGWPALSVPAGLVDGLPVGLQIIGRPNSEPAMLRLAQAFLSLRD
jgi:Asp-tRNA(Asn)/Glu-tRNA(Gln) amidotransferase A subunit family amidase